MTKRRGAVQLIEYNSLILGSQIREAGGQAQVTAIIGDDLVGLVEALGAALKESPDLVLVLSGSSAGSHDFTAAALRQLGDVLVHGIAVRPGHPVVMGHGIGYSRHRCARLPGQRRPHRRATGDAADSALAGIGPTRSHE